MLILSVRNKLIIFINWAWNYFSKNSSFRLILKDDEQVQLVKAKKIKAKPSYKEAHLIDA
jgi:hypothetical protein